MSNYNDELDHHSSDDDDEVGSEAGYSSGEGGSENGVPGDQAGEGDECPDVAGGASSNANASDNEEDSHQDEGLEEPLDAQEEEERDDVEADPEEEQLEASGAVGSDEEASHHSEDNLLIEENHHDDGEHADEEAEGVAIARDSSTHSVADERSDSRVSGAELADEDHAEESVRIKKENSQLADDIFGDAGDISSEDEDVKPVLQKGPAVAVEEAEPTGRFPGESDEEPEEPEQDVVTVIEAELPRIRLDLGKSIHFVKFPNFLSVEPRPFDPETYEDEVDEDEVLDEEGRSRLKLKCENTIRWRNVYDDEGNLVHESNAKIVRWSDGSMSLYLGAEIFDIHVQPLQDHNHVFIRQGAGLLGQSVFRTKLTFRPYSTESFTHRKLTLSMADKSNKAQKVKVLVSIGKDPEAQKQELLKKEEERLRANQRRESQQRRIRERAAGHGLTAGYLEDRDESDDENSFSISAIKRNYKQNAKEFKGAHIYSSDSEAESEAGPSRLEKSKHDLESEEEGESSSKKKPRIIEESDEEEA